MSTGMGGMFPYTGSDSDDPKRKTATDVATAMARYALAMELLDWLDTKPLGSLESLVIELRQRLDAVQLSEREFLDGS